ncbi:MAG: HesA/MoeB/ThiF family protein [Flavobacteriales bacterium]|nr:HesA/MoeB/ThiF family protein [Flavobacteriales bacterium]
MRYARHISLSEIGEVGQQKLLNSRILVIGAGGLGCPALQYLAAAGIGTLGIIDGDVVDESNLQRQILFNTADVGKKKVDAARSRLSAMNPDLSIEVYPENLVAENALKIISNYDLVIDGTDNFATRFLVNDACVKLGKPFVYGAIHKFEGQISVFNYKDGPTYRCLFPEPPSQNQIPNCSEVGVLGVLPGIIGSYQAAEAMKILLGIGEPLSGKLKMINLLSNSEQTISFAKNDEQVEKAKNIKLEESYTDSSCAASSSIQPEALTSWLEEDKQINLLDVREPHETPKLNHSDVIYIPLGEISERADELPKNKPLVVFCQAGVRSMKAIGILQESGFEQQLINLEGGMAAFHQHTINI